MFLNSPGSIFGIFSCTSASSNLAQSNGETEFSDEEIALIKFIADNYGNISLSMSIDKNIKDLNDNETRKEEQQ